MSKKIKVLLVEDDPNLGILLSEYINAKGFECVLNNNGQQGYETFVKGHFDFLIFDVMMPIKDGFTLAKEVRELDKNIPILFLTAKSLKEDTLKGFNVGADDYMTKPFIMEELLARMNAIIRRMPSKDEESNNRGIYEIGVFNFNSNQQILSYGNNSNKLTTKESELLKLLCKNKNSVLNRNSALKAIWGDDNYFNGRSMDVYIAKLRKHLKEDPNIEIINIHGKGFKLLINNQ